MKNSLLTAAVGLAIATAPMAHADSPGSYRITLGGQGTHVVCSASGGGGPSQGMDVDAVPGTTEPSKGMAEAEIGQNGTRVEWVRIAQDSSGSTIWVTAPSSTGSAPNSAVVKSNDTWAANGRVIYTITGTVSPQTPGASGGPTPFEFDATCPALR
jgi:hypothetical protein